MIRGGHLGWSWMRVTNASQPAVCLLGVHPNDAPSLDMQPVS